MKKISYGRVVLKADKRLIDSGVPSIKLMERAAACIRESYTFNGKTAVICGSGNNGGDGYALAYLLSRESREVVVYYLSQPQTADAQYFCGLCRVNGVEVKPFISGALNGFNTVVDCIFGIGLSRPAEGLFLNAIDEINAFNGFVISADIPSGILADNGLSKTCVKADMTVTFGALKPGHLLNCGPDNCGKIVICDIGTTVEPCAYLFDDSEALKVFSGRFRNSNKGTFGYVGIIGGSLCYSGAAKLANIAAAAMRSGAGVVRLCVGESIVNSVAPYILESTLFPLEDDGCFISYNEEKLSNALAGLKALSVGMGMGHGRETDLVIEYVIRNFNGTLILDADALNALARLGVEILQDCPGNIIITPHPGEFARLNNCTVEDVLSKPIEMAVEFARKNSVVVLLKGCSTVVTDGKRVYVSDSGCVGQATAGSGDVLSGVLTAVCGYYSDMTLATAASAYLCGKAACLAQDEVGSYSLIASDTVSKLHLAIKDIQK